MSYFNFEIGFLGNKEIYKSINLKPNQDSDRLITYLYMKHKPLKKYQKMLNVFKVGKNKNVMLFRPILQSFVHNQDFVIFKFLI